MKRNHLSICDLLQRRQNGFVHRNDRQRLFETSVYLADKRLVDSNEIKVATVDIVWQRRTRSICLRRTALIVHGARQFARQFVRILNGSFHLFWPLQTIPCIDDRSRSSYMAVTNSNGIAAMTHSNRCISLIDTGTMKRIAEINGLTRTVWTLCFHPSDLKLLATGDLGGRVCVFHQTVSQTPESPSAHAGSTRVSVLSSPPQFGRLSVSLLVDADPMEVQRQLSGYID